MKFAALRPSAVWHRRRRCDLIKLVLDEIVRAIQGDSRTELRPYSIAEISLDSRTTKPGSVFFAIAGERFDGHDFVAAAFEAGAVAAVVQRAMAEKLTAKMPEWLAQGRALILVDEVTAALGRLAHFHRTQVSAEVIAVVGSNGKTTTKSMIDHVLRGKLAGSASPKSYNNAIGVPLTLLGVSGADEYVVVEMGTNHPGEIATLAAIAEPNIAVITSIAEEHLEGLRDLAGVAAEECAVLPAVRAGGFAALNVDAPYLRDWPRPEHLTAATFGTAADADLRVGSVAQSESHLRFVVNDRFEYRVPVIGAHNALNAAAAIAVARRLGLTHEEVAERLATFRLPAMRNERLNLSGVEVINDAYNANPGSVRAAIDTLETLPSRGRKIGVFGEMRELGAVSDEMHRRIAERLLSSRLDAIYLIGTSFERACRAASNGTLFTRPIVICESVEQCAALLGAQVRGGDTVLLKASRGVGLERILPLLEAALAQSASAA